MLATFNDNLDLLRKVLTGDESWVYSYGYGIETKAQSYQLKCPEEPRPKKTRQVQLNVKVLLFGFFDCNGVVHHEFLLQGRNVNKEYIHTYIIGSYNPSVRIINLVSHITYVECVNFIHKWRDLQF